MLQLCKLRYLLAGRLYNSITRHNWLLFDYNKGESESKGIYWIYEGTLPLHLYCVHNSSASYIYIASTVCLHPKFILRPHYFRILYLYCVHNISASCIYIASTIFPHLIFILRPQYFHVQYLYFVHIISASYISCVYNISAFYIYIASTIFPRTIFIFLPQYFRILYLYCVHNISASGLPAKDATSTTTVDILYNSLFTNICLTKYLCLSSRFQNYQNTLNMGHTSGNDQIRLISEVKGRRWSCILCG